MSDVNPAQLHPRVLAYLGDAVFELHIRKHAIAQPTNQTEDLHAYVTKRVRAEAQAEWLALLEPQLTETEKDIARRGRNVTLGASRRGNQTTHRQATAFEALIGYLSLKDPDRLRQLLDRLDGALFS